MARNCHKSVYNAVFLNELRPVYLYPGLPFIRKSRGKRSEWTDYTRTGGDSSGGKSGCFCSCNYIPPPMMALFLMWPVLARCVHRRGNTSDSWMKHTEAHFGFHPYFPKNGNEQSADVVIHSLHKTLPSLTQTALLHINGTNAGQGQNLYVSGYFTVQQSFLYTYGFSGRVCTAFKE